MVSNSPHAEGVNGRREDVDLLMPSVPNDEANVILLCKCQAGFDVLGRCDIDGVIDIIA